MKTTTRDHCAAEFAAGYIIEHGYWIVALHSVRDAGGCTCPERDECGSPAKHPHSRLCPHGIYSATSQLSRVAEWWTRREWANVGLATGPSGLIALDIDPRNGGLENLRRLVDQHGPLPPTLTCLTGGGGQHYYFRACERQPASGDLAPGVEVKARGGMVVAPPSLHSSGQRYTWLDPDAPVKLAPHWISHWDAS